MLLSALNTLLEQQEIDPASVPIVICGDFNDVINSEACKALTAVIKLYVIKVMFLEWENSIAKCISKSCSSV